MLTVTPQGHIWVGCWAEAPIKIARMTLTIKLDRNWSSFQLANSAPPLSVTDSAIAPSARTVSYTHLRAHETTLHLVCRLLLEKKTTCDHWAEARLKIARMTLTIKRDGNWSSFQLANSALPLSVTSSAIAPSARMHKRRPQKG